MVILVCCGFVLKTLTSSRVALNTNYAVGVLHRGQVCLSLSLPYYQPGHLSSFAVFFPVKDATNMMMGGRYATKQLHLNPIKAVVQLRPSMKYIDDADVAKKKQNREAGITDGDDEEMVEAEASESKSELTLLQVCISVS
jgi:hypothetical protein